VIDFCRIVAEETYSLRQERSSRVSARSPFPSSPGRRAIDARSEGDGFPGVWSVQSGARVGL